MSKVNEVFTLKTQSQFTFSNFQNMSAEKNDDCERLRNTFSQKN